MKNWKKASIGALCVVSLLAGCGTQGVGGVAVVRGQQQVSLIIARILHLGCVGLSAILIGALNAHGHRVVFFEQLFGNVVRAHLLERNFLRLVGVFIVVVRISALPEN